MVIRVITIPTMPEPEKAAPTLEEAVDADIAAFAEYFCGELKNDSLSKPERAILKTYLFFKTHVEPQKERERL